MDVFSDHRICVHLCASAGICGHLWASARICLHLSASVCICLHLRASVCICAHLCASVYLRKRFTWCIFVQMTGTIMKECIMQVIFVFELVALTWLCAVFKCGVWVRFVQVHMCVCMLALTCAFSSISAALFPFPEIIPPTYLQFCICSHSKCRTLSSCVLCSVGNPILSASELMHARADVHFAEVICCM